MSSGHEQITSYQEQASDWAQLAQENPDAFEAMRIKLVDNFIKNSPESVQRRLKGMQWKIEHVRSKANSPAEALAAISEMMWESAQQLSEKQQDLLDLCTGKKSRVISARNSAKILNFRQVAKQ